MERIIVIWRHQSTQAAPIVFVIHVKTRQSTDSEQNSNEEKSSAQGNDTTFNDLL